MHTHAHALTGVFNLTTISAAISTAVDDAFGCDEEERKKRLKQLQLRWHPGTLIIMMDRLDGLHQRLGSI
jgi:hypothetical protein